LASTNKGLKIVMLLHFAISLILISGFYLPGGITDETPMYVVWHGNLVYFVLQYLTMSFFVLFISFLFYPPLHERIYQAFPHANLAPLLTGIFYLLIAYGLWRKRGVAWTVAVAAAVLTIPVDFLFAFTPIWGLVGMLGLVVNLFIVYQLTRREVRELYGNPPVLKLRFSKKR